MASAYYVRRPGFCWQRISHAMYLGLIAWFDAQLLGLQYDFALECEGYAVMAIGD